MVNVTRKEDCCGCAACVQVCPKSCIAMVRDAEGFDYPKADSERCISCGLCEKVCPVSHAQAEPAGEPKAFAAYGPDKDRAESSSGGIFAQLARQTLAQGGLVFGAAMAEDGKTAVHMAIDGEGDLPRLQGSKYLQSHMGNCFRQAKEALDVGRAVLFTGTPCQIEGLLHFLGRDYENLVTADVICHGVPSEKLWQKYLNYQQHRYGSRVTRVSFRDKRQGWKSFSMALTFENGKQYAKKLYFDTYLQLFLQDLCLRPSCYACPSRKKHRVSDLTLGDFWGCDRVCPEMDDDTGLSLVLIHSEKGQRAFDALSLKRKTVTLEQALTANKAVIRSPKMPENREAVLSALDGCSIDAVGKRYLRKLPWKQALRLSLPEGAVRKIKRVLHR
ncbi:MAG: Coenzyme F420 hydrogenase/dehydrogenase, beta subunit C-terminal domain [Eubacteriales bacterium]|nr:Coenzyme F420 hydrogenase/dehydrogenase, beta subunit C-terminal domain [Eubacteriales bacterium]